MVRLAPVFSVAHFAEVYAMPDAKKPYRRFVVVTAEPDGIQVDYDQLREAMAYFEIGDTQARGALERAALTLIAALAEIALGEDDADNPADMDASLREDRRMEERGFFNRTSANPKRPRR